jgi:NTP pyrophosphatase (non-canonical NTP hydrolase)
MRLWQEHNFPARDTWEPLVGVQEEAGELAHAHLQEHQGIRGTKEEHEAEARDACGDLIVFLADYCNARGWDLQDILDEVWPQVQQRDFRPGQSPEGL